MKNVGGGGRFYPFFKYCPASYKDYYFNKRASDTLGYEYNWREPKTYNEKIKWLIHNERLKSKSLLTDKIKVKAYVTETIGEGHCAPVYGIWDKFDDIDFSYIPPEFVLKANHAWNTNLILKKKYVLNNKNKIRKITQKWLKIKYEQYSCEPQYENIEPKLFIEYLRPQELGYRRDFQVHCLNGIPMMIEIQMKDLIMGGSVFYDTDWKKLKYTIKSVIPNSSDFVEKPVFLPEMLEYAKQLATGFSYVRIDFAKSRNNIHVVEMTFTPHSAIIPFSDKAYDYELGELLKLPV